MSTLKFNVEKAVDSLVEVVYHYLPFTEGAFLY